jgi:hypothetical protein
MGIPTSFTCHRRGCPDESAGVSRRISLFILLGLFRAHTLDLFHGAAVADTCQKEPETRMRFQRSAVIAAVGALTMAWGISAAQPVQAATCKITGITPASVAVGLSPVAKTWGVKTSGCKVKNWFIFSEEKNIWAEKGDPRAAVDPYDLSNWEAGNNRIPMTVLVVTTSDPVVATVDLSLRRRGTWGSTFNAAPEPVTKGGKITLKGKITRANWDTMRYAGYSNKKIRVQFRAAGKKTFKNVKTVVAAYGGKVNTTVTAKTDGAWRLYWPGNTITGVVASSADSVDVRS